MTMEKPSESTIESIPKLAVLLLPPFGATALLWLTSPNEISAWQGLAALILLGLPWWTFLKWRNSPQEEIPLFPMVALVYSIYFALPLFWGDRNGVGLGAGEPLSGGIISRVLIMVLFGILSLRSVDGYRPRTPSIFPMIRNAGIISGRCWSSAAFSASMRALLISSGKGGAR